MKATLNTFQKRGSRSRSRSRSDSRRRRRRSSDRRSRSPSVRKQRNNTPPPPKKVCVSKLTRNVTKDHVLEIFTNFGNIIYCDFPLDKSKAWLHQGNAYVEFEKVEEADDCIKKMDGGKIGYFWNLNRSIKRNLFFQALLMAKRSKWTRCCKQGLETDLQIVSIVEAEASDATVIAPSVSRVDHGVHPQDLEVAVEVAEGLHSEVVAAAEALLLDVGGQEALGGHPWEGLQGGHQEGPGLLGGQGLQDVGLLPGLLQGNPLQDAGVATPALHLQVQALINQALCTKIIIKCRKCARDSKTFVSRKIMSLKPFLKGLTRLI